MTDPASEQASAVTAVNGLHSPSFSRILRFVGFAIVGLSGILVDGGLVAFLTGASIHYIIANAVAYACALSWNISLNYTFVWNIDVHFRKAFAKYAAVDVVLFVHRLVIVAGLVEFVGMPDVTIGAWVASGELLATLTGIAVVALTKFWIVDNHVFVEGDADA